jgi:hypothetical protein
MTDNPLRRWARRAYLDEHQRQRRADLKAEGARRIDVTLRGKALDDYATVRAWLEGLNRLGIERGIFTKPKTGPDGMTFTVPPFRLSDTEVIKMALSRAASAIWEDEERARKQGLRQMIAD